MAELPRMTNIERCPTCGVAVHVVGGEEGTLHYEPAPPYPHSLLHDGRWYIGAVRMNVIERREAILRVAEDHLRRLLGDDHGMGEEFFADVAEQVVGGLADQLAGAVAALEQIDRETRHISGNAGRLGQIARDALAALGHSTIGGRYE